MSTRRNFLKSTSLAGIFACLPTIEIRQGISIDLIKQCCTPESYRWKMADPFVEDGRASATDGRIGVRVFDSMRLADTSNELKIPPLSRVFDQLWKPRSVWQDWPTAEYEHSNRNPCYVCKGIGFLGELRECDHCSGEGVFYSERGDDWDCLEYEDCPKCAIGFVSQTVCQRCHGKPWADAMGATHRLSDDLVIDASYHHIVSRFPNVQWSVGAGYPSKASSSSSSSVLLFRFEGGQGIVMPILEGKTNV